MRRRIIACLLAALLSLPSTGLAGTTEKESLPEWWRAAEATPGMELKIRETARNDKIPAFRGKKSITAAFSASGFPKDKRFELWGSWLDQRAAKFLNIVVDQDGILRMINPKNGVIGPELSAINLVLGSFAKGEPATFALVSIDREAKAFARIVPFPLEARDGACRLWLELMSPQGTAFLVQGEGFEPGEEVKSLSRSDGERLTGRETISPEGTYGPVVVFPAAVSRKHKASYSVSGGTCSVKVE